MAHQATDSAKPPSAILALTELPRALAEFGSLPLAVPLLWSAPRGDGHPVLVLPGFSTTDRSTGVLRRYLTRLGYDAHAWELGRNLGPRAIGRQGEKLIARLEEVYAKTGRKVSLVGWSLGGVLARQLSRRRPDLVRQIITLGSPFAGDPRSTNVWRLYEMMSGQRMKDPDTRAQLHESFEAPPVPSLSHGKVASSQKRRPPTTLKCRGVIAAWASTESCSMPWRNVSRSPKANGSHSSEQDCARCSTPHRGMCIRVLTLILFGLPSSHSIAPKLRDHVAHFAHLCH
jgi:pimeloyl-ACP methyl ester carboxylesterase